MTGQSGQQVTWSENLEHIKSATFKAVKEEQIKSLSLVPSAKITQGNKFLSCNMIPTKGDFPKGFRTYFGMQAEEVFEVEQK